MKVNKSLLGYFFILVVAAALYRVSPGRMFGFAPHIALAMFGGAVIKNKGWALAMPLISMLVSDFFYQILFLNGLSPIEGFYSGQVLNYVVLASVVVVGFLMKNITVPNIALHSLLAPTWFFLISNFTVWIGSVNIPQTGAGLLETYVLGLPFYKASILGTFVFSAILFGSYYLVMKRKFVKA